MAARTKKPDLSWDQNGDPTFEGTPDPAMAREQYRKLQDILTGDMTLADKVQQLTFNPVTMLGPAGDGKERVLRNKGMAGMFERQGLKARMRLRSAQRFTMSVNFVEAAMAVALDSKNILSRISLAHLPFDTVWIEFGSVYADAYIMRHTEDDDPRLMFPRDTARAGYLIHRLNPANPEEWYAARFHETISEGRTQLAMTAFEKRHDFVEAFQRIGDKDAERAGIQIGSMGWAHSDNTGGWPVGIEKMLAQGGTVIDQYFMRSVVQEIGRQGASSKELLDQSARDLYQAADNSRGEMRLLIAMLAMINNVPTRHVYARNAAGTYRSRLRTHHYLDHNIVNLTVTKVKTRVILNKAAKTYEAARRKRHPVRGHWRTAEYTKTLCRHVSIADSDGKNALCGDCGRLLNWVDHHERGDASLGFVTHEYKVK